MKKYKTLNNFFNVSLLRKVVFFSTKEFTKLEPVDSETGNLKEVLNAGGWHNFLTEKHTQHGPLILFSIKNRTACSIANPKYWTSLSHLNTRPDHLRGYLIPLYGEKTINLLNGKERENKNKAYITQMFSKESLISKYSKALEGHLKNGLDDWSKYALSGEKIPLDEKMGVILITNMLDIIYGKRNMPQKEIIKLANKMKYVINELEIRSFGKVYDAQSEKELFESCADIRNFVKELIKEWEARDKTTAGTCFLDAFEMETDLKFKFDTSVTFLLAGIHTTKFLVPMCIYHIVSNPQIQKKLQEELDKQIEGKVVTIDSLKNLKYLRACVNETLRLTPATTTTYRIDNENDNEIGEGLIIPKGTAIISPIAYVFQSEEFWQNSKEYNPDRFREHGLVHNFQFNPFGFAGGRVCIGKQLAGLGIRLILASFFKNFNVKLSEGQTEPKVKYLSGSSIEEEIYVEISQRH